MGRGLGQTLSDIGSSIKEGASMAWEGVKDGVASVWEGVKSFSEHTANLFTEGQYASNEEIYDMKLTRFNELLNSPVLVALDNRTSAGYLTEVMCWDMASKRQTELDSLAKDLNISPETYVKLQQEACTGFKTNNAGSEIEELEARALKLEKKNPEEARWLRAKAEMMRDGIEVSEGTVDISNALQNGSMSYYEIKHLMDAADPGEQREHLDNLKKIKEFKDEFNQEPSRFMLYYDCDPEKLTDPERLRQDGGSGPVNSIFSEALLNLINDPNLVYEGDINKAWLKGRFDKTSAYLQEYDIKNIDSLVQGMTKGTCKIQAEWEYAVATEQYNGNLNDFYEEGYRQGRFGMMKDADSPSFQWVNETAYFNNKPLLSGPGLGDKKVNEMVDKNGASDWGIININRYGGQSDHRTLVHRENGQWISYEHDDRNDEQYGYQWRKKPVVWSKVKGFHQ